MAPKLAPGLAAHRLFKTRFQRFMIRPEAIRKTYGYLKKGSIFVWTQKRLSFSESVTEKTRMAISAWKNPFNSLAELNEIFSIPTIFGQGVMVQKI